MLLYLPVAISLYIIFRLVLPLPVSKAARCLLALLPPAVMFGHLLLRYRFGGMASAELPAWSIAFSGGLFGTFFLLFFLLVVRDILLLLLRTVSAVVVKPPFPILFKAPPPFSAVQWALGLLLLSASLSAFGVWQAVRVPEVRKVEITVPGLPAELDGLNIVFLSDLHVSALLQQSRTEAIVRAVNAQEADIILIGGDLIDGSPKFRAGAVAPLAQLRSRYGVYACPGNHEYYSGYADWMEAFADLGIVVLQNSHVLLHPRSVPLAIAGTTDEAALRFGLPVPNLALALIGLPEGVPRILLEHRPENAPANAHGNIALQLSGHTHGGQFLGLNLVVRHWNNGFLSGMYDVENMKLYVSTGAGLWAGMPLRVGVPSEIAQITLRRGGQRE